MHLYVCLHILTFMYVYIFFFSGTFGVMATFENQRPGYFLVTWEDLF